MIGTVRARGWLSGLVVAVVAALTGACQGGPVRLKAETLMAPIPPGSVVPQMAALGDGRVAASWFEPRPDKGYRFRAALRTGHGWGEALTIDDSPDIAMFSADLPGLAALPGGALVAYWERRDVSTGNPYATAIQLARSLDQGRTWEAMPSPHRGGPPGQHSFMAPFSLADGLGLVWLDASRQSFRPAATPDGKPEWRGAIGLRFASFTADGRPSGDAFVDPITCECCPTAATVTARGPLVAYRDRVTPDVAPEEVRDDAGSVRDIQLTRYETGRWSAPRRVHADDWVIAACPDNGPALDAIGSDVAVAWWTGAGDVPRVSVAFSGDSGDTLGPALRVSEAAATGQVTVAVVDAGRAAIVGWLEGGQARARWVARDGRRGEAIDLGKAPLRARLPRWIRDGASILALWTNSEGDARAVRLTRLSWNAS
jgi:hypothetical protein